jgi:hypothetical protein
VVVLVVVAMLRIMRVYLVDLAVVMLIMILMEMQHQPGQAIRSLDLVQQYHRRLVGAITVERPTVPGIVVLVEVEVLVVLVLAHPPAPGLLVE